MSTKTTSCIVLLTAFSAAPALAAPQHNPGYDRPGIGFTPASLQTGDIIYEQGLPDFAKNDDTTAYTADGLLRVGIGKGFEAQLGTSWNWLNPDPGNSVDGRGDTSLAVKYAPDTGKALTWGVLGSVEFTDGDDAFAAQDNQYLAGLSVNWQHTDTHSLGLYAEFVDGDADTKVLAVNSGWALSDTLGVYVEVAVQDEQYLGGGSQGGAGITWMVTPRLQLDASLRHRIGGYANDWEGGLGAAWYFGG